MAFYFVTGKLGNGKTLVAVSRIVEKLKAGLPVATNIDLDLSVFTSKMNQSARVIRIPDKPTLFDLECIGRGNETYDESLNGLLVLDECGTWFNARNWSDKTRQPVNNWFLHARKLGWDVILIVQDISIVDNQAREALSEFTAFCKRMDNFRVPFIGGLYKSVTGSPLKLPKVHVARVVYGAAPTDPLSDRWIYRGTDLYDAYDTKQIFISDYPHGPHSVLPNYYHHRRTFHPRNRDFYMRVTKIYLKKLKAPLAIALGIVFGLATSYGMTRYLNHQFYSEYKRLSVAIQKLQEVERLQAESAPEEAPDALTEPLPEPDTDPFVRLADFRIVGYSSYSGRVIYDLSRDAQPAPDDSSISDPKIITTEDLASMYAIEPRGPCNVRLSAQGVFHDVYCF